LSYVISTISLGGYSYTTREQDFSRKDLQKKCPRFECKVHKRMANKQWGDEINYRLLTVQFAINSMYLT
jgi:hypothetical protein